MNWKEIISGPVDNIPIKFNEAVFRVLQKYSPIKNNLNTPKNSFSKKRRVISRKISKYKKRLCYSNNIGYKKKSLLDMIEKLREEKKSLFLEEKLFFERKAVEQIRTNCKYFYKYANSFKKVQTEPSILQDDQGELIMDQKVIADMLQQQFKSVFSNPLDCKNYSPRFKKPTITHPLPDLEIITADIVKAINEIKTSSSCPKYEIPAKVFKECKYTLSVPLKMLWIKSFETGRVPQHYKHQLVILIYKKGPKTKCENFRPISLTAHTIKIFE